MHKNVCPSHHQPLMTSSFSGQDAALWVPPQFVMDVVGPNLVRHCADCHGFRNGLIVVAPWFYVCWMANDVDCTELRSRWSDSMWRSKCLLDYHLYLRTADHYLLRNHVASHSEMKFLSAHQCHLAVRVRSELPFFPCSWQQCFHHADFTPALRQVSRDAYTCSLSPLFITQTHCKPYSHPVCWRLSLDHSTWPCHLSSLLGICYRSWFEVATVDFFIKVLNI